MEKTIKTGLIISMVLLLIILVAVIYKVIVYKINVKNKKGRGKKFEQEFSLDIAKWAQENNFFYIEPSLYKNNNKLFEVDGIIVNEKGIFVIETKSITGNIEGDYNDKTWYKVFKNTKYEIPNVISQNVRHIKHIEEIFSNLEINLYSILVFEDFNKTIKIINNPEWNLITKDTIFTSDLMKFIQNTDSTLNQHTVNTVYNTLSSLRTNSTKDKVKFKSYRYKF
ncbi:nuclease-related domain-containing protein [Mycoplasma zalophi]|uniref:nuclease-related domain-containing protein n=1 Tax=Mycoplasma zalophi TaxID=191287 RepID=UPI001C11AF79|nr:nuclease-related domain-containing protein [Mycoplasma zalophi]MBU4690854.1 NERD domain-containing protein [Mycoplasma zalophi]